ncbi:DUF2802 domain-containing protein [uncultured Neptuniibacter sp.]|uniref:DUF2802 domain-containing protein n=1 Tax=uncultured Neptuniibacter sp. TaxID=502143 RepID=UPI002603236C|nr:DUF2802 domain-containing protein [uncultured Neptuniibacter sp.]
MAVSVLDILLVIITLGACSACFILFRRLKQYERRHQALINVLRNEIQAMTNSSIGMGRRLIEVEQKLNLTADKQQELENRDPSALAYNQATRLMEMGADVDDLVQNCGIGRPEAELMALLHKELHAPHQSLGRD